MIRCICVGKIKEKALQECINEYIKRLQPYHKVTIVEVADEATDAYDYLGMEKEEKRILGQLKANEYVVLLDLQGKEYDSIAFSKKIDQILSDKGNKLAFVIGGSYGVSEAVKQRANLHWKLSACTFPHGIVRLLLVEQVYRSFRILSKEPYHK